MLLLCRRPSPSPPPPIYIANGVCKFLPKTQTLGGLVHPQPFWDPSKELKQLRDAWSMQGRGGGTQTTTPAASGPRVPISLQPQAQQQLLMLTMICDGPDSSSSPTSDPRRRSFLP